MGWWIRTPEAYLYWSWKPPVRTLKTGSVSLGIFLCLPTPPCSTSGNFTRIHRCYKKTPGSPVLPLQPGDQSAVLTWDQVWSGVWARRRRDRPSRRWSCSPPWLRGSRRSPACTTAPALSCLASHPWLSSLAATHIDNITNLLNTLVIT